VSSHIEEFRVSLDGRDCLTAARHALRSRGWTEHPSDRLETWLTSEDDAAFYALLHRRVPFTRWFIDRYLRRSIQAPSGGGSADAEIHAVFKRAWIVRIAIRTHAAGETGVTIAGSDLGSPWGHPLRSVIRGLRQSMELQSATGPWPDAMLAGPSVAEAQPTASFGRRWFAATVAGVVVSIAVLVAVSMMWGVDDSGGAVGSWPIGVAIGTIVAGLILPARSPKDWAVAAAVVFLADITTFVVLLGVVGVLISG
jgi:hypothetical protein